MIERYLKGEELVQPSGVCLPDVYVEPVERKGDGEGDDLALRSETPRAPAEWRKRNFAEVEVAFSVEEAAREACRCLRCDLEFTQSPESTDEEK